jgi:hypothetical protein
MPGIAPDCATGSASISPTVTINVAIIDDHPCLYISLLVIQYCNLGKSYPTTYVLVN